MYHTNPQFKTSRTLLFLFVLNILIPYVQLMSQAWFNQVRPENPTGHLKPGLTPDVPCY